VGAIRSRLRRWHVWLGWLVGLPILLWVVTGLVMVARPIDEVRGTDLLRPHAPVRSGDGLVLPRLGGLAVTSLKLEQRGAGPQWIIGLEDGGTRLADGRTGAMLPPLSAAEAVSEVAGRYTGRAKVAGVSPTDPTDPPIELRRPIAAWKVSMDDGTHFYVDSGTGEVIARRTRWWRIYDFMWGLHIMDPVTREDTHNPWAIGFGSASLVMALLALILLPMTRRKG
jgi:hypothetical protein